MTDDGRYGDLKDHRTYTLPDGWEVVSETVLATARSQTLTALDRDRAVAALSRYYDRSSTFAGSLFLELEPTAVNVLGAADLLAVTALSIDLDARQIRWLLDEKETRGGMERRLANIDPSTPVTDLEHDEGGSADLLLRMWELHDGFKGLLSDGGNPWVTAAKLCARKRPRLFPVRDNLVCEYLGGGGRLRPGDGRPGDFSIDIQVFAYLLTDRAVTSALSWLRAELEDTRGLRVDEIDLRLLDAALWMAASGKG